LGSKFSIITQGFVQKPAPIEGWIWAFPFGSGYALQCQLALRDSVGISAAIPNAKTAESREYFVFEHAFTYVQWLLDDFSIAIQ
jgi:hypothetical protein